MTGIGRAQLALGRPTEARPVLERALRIREVAESDQALKGKTRFALAEALWATGDTSRAARLATAAKDAYDSAPLHARETRKVEIWLSA